MKPGGIILIKKLYSSLTRKLFNFLDNSKCLFSVNELKKASPSSVMLVCHDVDRGFVWEGMRYAQLLDSINDRLMIFGIDTISVSAPFSKKAKINYKNPVNVNGLFARTLLFAKLRAFFLIRQQRDSSVIGAWTVLLDRISPKIIIGIQPSVELCIAAQLKGIWVADLQHGILSGEGYYGLEHRNIYDQEGWPSCILCWDHASLRWVEDNIAGFVQASVIGNPWIIRFINKLEGDKLVVSTPIHPVPPSFGRLKVLVTPQWGGQFEQHRPTGLPIGLLNFIKNAGQAYDWWIRIHPVMINNVGRESAFGTLMKEFSSCQNIYWEHSTELPLPQILTQVDLHFTLSSAVTIEAGWFGIPTALLGDNISEMMVWFGSEIENGSAEIVGSDHDSIAQWINKCEAFGRNKRRARPLAAEPLDYFIENVNACVKSNLRIEDRLKYN